PETARSRTHSKCPTEADMWLSFDAARLMKAEIRPTGRFPARARKLRTSRKPEQACRPVRSDASELLDGGIQCGASRYRPYGTSTNSCRAPASRTSSTEESTRPGPELTSPHL